MTEGREHRLKEQNVTGQRAGKGLACLGRDIILGSNIKCTEGGKEEEAGRVVWDQTVKNLEAVS